MREVAAVLKALSDETRLKMLGLLFEEGEMCVCDFVEVLGITQSKASRHLRYMVNAGLLADRREGVWSYYRVVARPGPLQKSVIAGMRKIVPQQVPDELFRALKAWRKRKAAGALGCGCAK
jgi:ArsR family transcriptional regulator, arsenate/arsenite/antimonite-responsive transcriptional repressor